MSRFNPYPFRDKSIDQSALLNRYVYVKRLQDGTFQFICKPPGGRWQLFYFTREEDATINQKNWRVLDYYQSKSTKRHPLEPGWSTFGSLRVNYSGTGQWEYALQESGQPDFMGGFHGDEIFTEMGIYVDGKRIAYEDTVTPTALTSTLTTGTGVTAGLDVRIVVDSKLYRPSSPTTVIATVKREYRFDPMGMTIKYTVKWEQAITLANCYIAMLPIARSATVSTKGRFLDEAGVMDISTASFTERHVDSYGVEYTNDTNDLCVRIEVLNPKVSLNGYANNGTLKTWISNAADYNKFYAARVQGTVGYVTAVGELWDVAFRVEGFMSN